MGGYLTRQGSEKSHRDRPCPGLLQLCERLAQYLFSQPPGLGLGREWQIEGPEHLSEAKICSPKDPGEIREEG